MRDKQVSELRNVPIQTAQILGMAIILMYQSFPPPPTPTKKKEKKYFI
jgi:hypothetical protein